MRRRTDNNDNCKRRFGPKVASEAISEYLICKLIPGGAYPQTPLHVRAYVRTQIIRPPPQSQTSSATIACPALMPGLL